MIVLSGATLVLPDRMLSPGTLVIDGDRITDVRADAPAGHAALFRGHYIVPGFVPGMPTINKPPVGLTDQEILCVIAYLQTLGGTPTVTLQTKHHYNTGTATAATEGNAAGSPPAPKGNEPGAAAGTSKGAAPR